MCRLIPEAISLGEGIDQILHYLFLSNIWLAPTLAIERKLDSRLEGSTSVRS